MKKRITNNNRRLKQWMIFGNAALAVSAMTSGLQAQSQTNSPSQSSDPLLNLMIKKGLLTEEEAAQVRAEAKTSQTNAASFPASKWVISDAIKSVELFGDVKFRYEYRSAQSASIGGVILDRYRYALRFGLRGDVMDNFYYGIRLETATNPRSPWDTFATSSAASPYVGPFGKSNGGISLGQVYLGWRPESWLEVTFGKMPNPLYTTAMVWDTDINPEGLAEKFNYSMGDVDFFATLGQFFYEDTNPNSVSAGFLNVFPDGHSTSEAFLLAWQGGFIYHIDKDMSFKLASTLYNYTGHGADSSPVSNSPGFSDIFVGQGSPFDANGTQRPGSNSGPPGDNGNNADGFFFNQTGINDLLILEFPFQFDFKIARLNARVFGDFAANLDGAARARNAVSAAAATFDIPNPGQAGFKAQSNDDKAYQIGFAIGNRDDLGLVYGGKALKGMWEARAYWQHVEQYALDANLLDSDFFEGRGNLQGVYTALAYSFADNMIGTVRYGYANRINKSLGTGGSNFDIPQVNPIEQYHLIQLDLTYRF
jgi:hypothetical protein